LFITMSFTPPEKNIIILGVKINDIPLIEVGHVIDNFLHGKKFQLIFTPNPEICLRAEQNSRYRDIINQSSLCIPDGVGLKIGAEILGQHLRQRLTGVDLTSFILDSVNLNREFNKIFIINNKKGLSNLTDIKKALHKKHPNIIVSGLDIEKINLPEIKQRIKKEKPDIVFTTLGAPKQELVLYELQRQGLTGPKLGLAVGGTFDFITGKQHRAPVWWRDLGLEWFYRFLKQPKRLGRIADATLRFPLVCMKWRQRIKSRYRDNVVAIIKQKNKYLIEDNRRFSGHHWQFPQGGITPDEDIKKAAVREASEELVASPDLFRVSKILPVHHQYEFGHYAELINGYKGQIQKFVILEYLGKDTDFNLKLSHEIKAIKWVTKKELLAATNEKRRSAVEKVIPYLN